MNHVIIDTSEGDARVVCDEYGDFLMFTTPEDAEAHREQVCDAGHSYIFPRKSRRPSRWWMFWRR